MIVPTKTQAIGILETTGFTPAIVALDAMDKTSSIQLIQLELNDYYGVVIKFVGGTAAVRAAMDAGMQVAQSMGGKPVSTILNRPDPASWPALDSKREFNPLIQQYVVIEPDFEPARSSSKERPMAEQPSFALGFLETQGFTAVFEAIDSACKAANVEVVCKEKLGGGYVTVVIKGDVAAVKAAVESGKTKVEGLGKLIAAHVIARPSAAALSLLPK
jgi:microcompartment protein CcmL/EutN